LLAGETAPDLGDLILKPGLRYGYLPQVPNVPPETVVRDVLSAPSPEAQRIEAELAGLEAWMARPDAWDAADASARMARYESLHVARGAARSESVIVNDPILNDLGVGEELLDQRFGSLSGGEKSKVLTARALANAKEKDVLLLDEPTNHMDVDTIERIERMRRETPEAPPTAPRAFRLSFRKGASGPGVVRLEGVAKSHGGRLLFADVDLELAKGDKLGLVGPNGAGKTTLLEVLIGRQEADAGSVFRGKNLAIGYFAQESEELDFSRTLLEEISSVRHPPPPESWARGLLGRFWFRGDAVHSRVGQLSGGERARLALAKFIAQDYDLLVLDEPTNHLDIESQQIVAAALQGAETQAFLRLLRWAEANGRVERIET